MTQSASEAPLLRIGSRGSPLALVQAREVQSRLAAAAKVDAERIEIKVIRTTGDIVQDRPLADAGGKGLFTKEIEEALLAGGIDLAVHSSKDLPTILPAGLVLAGFLPREDARDAFISRKAKTLRELPPGAVVGTASPRRQALVKRLRPDLTSVMLRGNVETRLRKLDAGEVDATLLRRRRLEAARSFVGGDRNSRPRRVLAGGRAGRDRHRNARGRCQDARIRRGDRRRRYRDRACRRARLPRRARRLLPHADRRPRQRRRRGRSASAASS